MNKDELMTNLQNRGFETKYFETAKEAVEFLESEIKEKSVGIGGSETVREIGLDKALMKNNTVYWHWLSEQTQKYGVKQTRDMAAQTQVYISSVNAIAQTGEIVNIDGSGNRIASIAYGHEQVYFIVGVNKVTDDFESAMWRARNVAAPKNAKRLNRKTPCALKVDKCYNCNSPERICNGFLTLERAMGGSKMTVILINEELGM